VANDICWSAVPTPKYLPERRSTVFPHHYTPVVTDTKRQTDKEADPGLETSSIANAHGEKLQEN